MYCKFCNLPSKGIRFQSTYPIKLQNFIFGNCGQHILYFVYSLYSVPRENCIFQFQCVYQSCTNDCLPLVRKIRGNTGIGGRFCIVPVRGVCFPLEITPRPKFDSVVFPENPRKTILASGASLFALCGPPPFNIACWCIL